MATKTAFMTWIDAELQADPKLAREVEELINEMKIEQEIVALREKRGLSQRDFAERLGTSQPYVAKLESGRIKNLGLKTLMKCAMALDATLSVRLLPRVAPTKAKKVATRPAKAPAARRALRHPS